MKKLLLLSVVALVSCSKVDTTPKHRVVKAQVEVSNTLIQSVKGTYDTLTLQIDCVGGFAQSGTTESIIIIPNEVYTPCYDADFGYTTWSESETKDVTYRIYGKNTVVRSGVIKFAERGHLTVII